VQILDFKKILLIINPKAGLTQQRYNIFDIIESFCERDCITTTLTTLKEGDAVRLVEKNAGEHEMVVCSGGDGTLNRFVNDTEGVNIPCELLYMPTGTGNDFAVDVGMAEVSEPFSLTEYVQGLPTVDVGGKEYRFINGVGYGIDGYCCEVGDAMKAEGKQPNYTSIAISGLLFHYKPTAATVIVDGKEYRYKKVWIAPTMYGRHYGGGMIPTPEQKRGSEELSVMVFHGSGKLKTLMIFPSIFKGEHVKSTKYVTVHTGREITVRFDDPRPLQIDGETHLGIKEYTAKAPVHAKL
jgi:diacylglycerol kinase family enzyme